MAILGPQFWEKLKKVTESVGMTPEDLIAVMSFESGLDPSAHNKNGNASGLIQFMPSTLKGVGYDGTPDDFRDLDAVKQLDYVQKYMQNQMSVNGGPFKSAAQYYVANLWPVALKLPEVRAQDPNAVILDSNPQVQRYRGISLKEESNAYKANAGLDVNHDGKITFGDLQSVIEGIKKSSRYQQAVAALEQNKNYAVGNSQKKDQETQVAHNDTSKPTNFLTRLDSFLDKFLSSVANLSESDNLIKKATYKKFLPKNQLLIKINSNNFIDSLEFARILCIALDEEAQADALIHTDRKNVEVVCNIHGPEVICQAAVEQLCGALSNTFKFATKKIGSVSIKTEVKPNRGPSYQELDIKLAQSAYRQFHLKFIK